MEEKKGNVSLEKYLEVEAHRTYLIGLGIGFTLGAVIMFLIMLLVLHVVGVIP